MPHGRAWKIWNKELLVSVVCKEQFKHEKFESFNRQVNGWGFKNGPDYKCYYNQFFLRGLPDLTSCMHRLDKPGKRLPNKLEEPDLYEISRRFPLPETNASIETEALSKNNSSMLLSSNLLTTPFAKRLSSKHNPVQMRSSSIDTAPSRSTASTAPKVVSRGSSENKSLQSQTALQKDSDSLQRASNPSLPGHYDAPSSQEMHLSLEQNPPSSYKTSEVENFSSYLIENEDTYERHRDFYRHTQDPYSYNALFDSKEPRYKRHKRESPSSFHEKRTQQMTYRNDEFFSFNQNKNVNHTEAGTAQVGCPVSTEEWAHYPWQEQNASQHLAQQLYYVQHTPGHIGMLHTNPVEHHNCNLNIHYAGDQHDLNKCQHNCHVPHQYKDRYPVQQHYVQDSQDHIDAYKDLFEHQHDESTVHHKQSPIGLDNHVPAAAKRSYPFSSRSNDPHQQHHYKDQYLLQQQEGTQETLGHIDKYNDPFNKSNKNYASSTQALDCPYHHRMGMDSQHHLQPQHLYEQTNQNGTHCAKNHGKLSAVDKSFSSYIPEDRPPQSHHSLSPLSSLMDPFLDFEPSPSMFDDKSK
ncbi:hypothetical protein ACHAW6_015229 [Cyclotella cf. meneghiniana]